MAKSNKNKVENKLRTIRLLIGGLVALLVVVVVVYGLFYSTGGPSGEIAEGSHYRIIDNPPSRRPGADITVTEFFSYYCIHCRNFDPLIEDFEKDLPSGANFVRAPVVFNPSWAIVAQAYLALETEGALERNHQRIFRAIHDNGKQFQSLDEMAQFVDGNGIAADDFSTAARSVEVRRRMARIDADQRKFGVASVPSLVVADKYVIDMSKGRKQSLEIALHLIALEQSSKSAGKRLTKSPSPN